MSYIVVYDANVIYSAALRDLLIRLALRRNLRLRVRWTDQIIDEAIQAVLRNRPDLDPDRLDITRQRMRAAIPDGIVTGYEPLIPALELPDPDDRHVLAAAIRCNAQAIVTYNLSDFPDETLAGYDIEAQHPDAFVANLVELNAATVVDVLHQMTNDLKNPPMDLEERLDHLHRLGLTRTVELLHEELGS